MDLSGSASGDYISVAYWRNTQTPKLIQASYSSLDGSRVLFSDWDIKKADDESVSISSGEKASFAGYTMRDLEDDDPHAYHETVDPTGSNRVGIDMQADAHMSGSLSPSGKFGYWIACDANQFVFFRTIYSVEYKQWLTSTELYSNTENITSKLDVRADSDSSFLVASTPSENTVKVTKFKYDEGLTIDTDFGTNGNINVTEAGDEYRGAVLNNGTLVYAWIHRASGEPSVPVMAMFDKDSGEKLYGPVDVSDIVGSRPIPVATDDGYAVCWQSYEKNAECVLYTSKGATKWKSPRKIQDGLLSVAYSSVGIVLAHNEGDTPIMYSKLISPLPKPKDGSVSESITKGKECSIDLSDLFTNNGEPEVLEYSITKGNLPEGLKLDAKKITGTVEACEEETTLTISVTNTCDKSCSLELTLKCDDGDNGPGGLFYALCIVGLCCGLGGGAFMLYRRKRMIPDRQKELLQSSDSI